MNDAAKTIVGLIVFLAVVSLLAFIVQGTDFFLYKYFAPKYEDVRRETFENSKAYRQGMIQELENVYREYSSESTGKEHKQALKSIVQHRYADFDMTQPQVPQYLKDFVNEMRK